jgi:hypothetical protein
VPERVVCIYSLPFVPADITLNTENAKSVLVTWLCAMPAFPPNTDIVLQDMTRRLAARGLAASTRNQYNAWTFRGNNMRSL